MPGVPKYKNSQGVFVGEMGQKTTDNLVLCQCQKDVRWNDITTGSLLHCSSFIYFFIFFRMPI